jgi:hypothetical protein
MQGSDKRRKTQAIIRLTPQELGELDELKALWQMGRNEVVAALVAHALEQGWAHPPK